MPVNKKRIVKSFLFSLFVVFILLSGHVLQAQEVKKITLLPFSVHAPSDPQVLQDKIFNALVRDLRKNQMIKVVSADEAKAGGSRTL